MTIEGTFGELYVNDMESTYVILKMRVGILPGSHKPIAPWEWRKMSKEERDEWR
jgi:hypothetical protein